MVYHPIEKIVKEQEEIVVENNNDNGVVTPTDTQPIDYEAEYKKMVAERDSFKAEAEKQKQMKDKYATENAEYKRKDLEKMSDDEKKAKEYQDLVAKSEQLATELKTMKLEKEALENGFTKDETEKLIKGNFSIKDIAEILNTRLEANTKSVTAGLMKKTTPSEPVGNAATGSQKQNDFVAFQKREAEKRTSGKVEL